MYGASNIKRATFCFLSCDALGCCPPFFDNLSMTANRLRNHQVIKYVRGKYGRKVHEAWAGKDRLAPALYSVRPVVGPWLEIIMEVKRGRGSARGPIFLCCPTESLIGDHMQDLRPEDGWVPLTAFLLPKPLGIASSSSESLELAHVHQVIASIDVSYSICIHQPSLTPQHLLQIKKLEDHVRRCLDKAHQIEIMDEEGEGEEGGIGIGGEGGEEGTCGKTSSSVGRQKRKVLGRGVHGDIRPPNIMVQLPLISPSVMAASSSAKAEPLPSVSDVNSLRVAFLDFDWAGVEGQARYPPLMSQVVPWPPGAEHGALISADHDRQLLASSFKRVTGLEVFPWQVPLSRT